MRKLVMITMFVLMGARQFTHASQYNLNVQIVQVCDDAGAQCTNLGPDGTGTDYLYASQLQSIWGQADISVSILPIVQWNNTEAQRLTGAEQSAIYNDTYTSASGDPLPAIPKDAVQVFFVMDHPGTGYNGAPSSGYVGAPLSNPNFQARNSGNAQLSIAGTFTSNGRAVMANEGYAAVSLSGTFAHELGHLLGLRHVEDVTAGAGAGTTQDPSFTLDETQPNLMWGGGRGPQYSDQLTVQQNNALTAEQVPAAVYNGLRLDPDGNGTGVLQVITSNPSTGDLNADGSVDAADAGIMFVNWGGTGIGDLNMDAIVDAADAGEMFSHWTGDAAAAPEPNSLHLWVLGLLIGKRRI